MKKRIVAMIIALCVLSVVTVFANGGGEYPSKDIQFIVGATAGGGSDVICRKVAEIAQKDLARQFVVVNRPGASDTVGPNLLMGAKPDGYTIGNLTYGAVVTGPYQSADLGLDGYDLEKLDFICMVTEESDALMVGGDTPYKTFDDLIAAAKANPGQVPVGDQGIGSRVNLVIRKIEAKYGVEFKKLSYSASSPQREAMLSGEIVAAVTSLGDFTPMLLDGTARGLVEFSTMRNKTYPNVPTSTELGLGDDLLSGSFILIAVPAGTPSDIKIKLENAFKAAATSQEFIDWTTTVGVTARYLGSSEIDAFITGVQKDFIALDELKAQGIL
jgi:tripartite-type tricarboxylate transporter receptor subunit TctC